MNTPGSVFLVWKSDNPYLPSLKNMVACTSRMVIRDLKKHHNRIFNKYGNLSNTDLLFYLSLAEVINALYLGQGIHSC